MMILALDLGLLAQLLRFYRWHWQPQDDQSAANLGKSENHHLPLTVLQLPVQVQLRFSFKGQSILSL